jgi:hypothetical protein
MSSWDNAVIHSSGPEETNRYLQGLPRDVYLDLNPRINHLTAPESTVTIEQDISVRCLQPPPLEPPGAHVIHQVYEDPRPSSPIHIIERPPPALMPPTLILREQPPERPPPIPPSEETVVIPHPVQNPPRSIVIDRFQAPARPRDIMIERWLPYGLPPPREIICKPPVVPAKPHPRPTITLNIHPIPPVNIVQKVKYLGVTPTNPDEYRSIPEPPLFNPKKFIEVARAAEVTERNIEKIRCPYASTENVCPNTGEIIRNCICALHGPGCPNIQRFPGTQAFNSGNGEIRGDRVVN